MKSARTAPFHDENSPRVKNHLVVEVKTDLIFELRWNVGSCASTDTSYYKPFEYCRTLEQEENCSVDLLDERFVQVC